ncbi:MAG: hypothetical protein JSV81_04025 [Anaerolineales bacterium]|nr:MAG: hypothetical protein JSV81_04025 [Anaerolineales bacterium]
MSDIQPANKGQEMWNMANALSRSTIIPKAFQGQAANCFVALDMANRMGASPMEIMQNIYVVHGTPGFSAKYAIAMANRSGVFKGPIHYEERGSGASLEVEAYAIVRETGQRVSFTASMAMAKAEKWDTNPKYKGPLAATMLRYRSATLLIRTTCPEVLLGMQTADEVEDVRYAKAAPVAEEDSPIAKLNAIVEAEPEEEVTVEEPPPATPTKPVETDEIPF